MRAIALLAAVVLFTIPSIRGNATVARALSLEQKTKIATLIVRGRAERIQPTWDIEGQSVQTLITLRVEEVMKGSAKVGQRLVIRQAGGRIGDFDHRVPGVSAWNKDDQVILFLENAGASLVEIGIGIGKYDVRTDSTGQWVAHEPKVALAHVDETGKMRIDEPAPAKPERLDAFEKRVRGYTDAPVRAKKSLQELPR